MKVTPRYLLEGAVYSLEQCGILLRDAVTLYEAKAFSSAVVLAVFAWEELGRSRKLRDFRKDVIENGTDITLKDIRDACEKHPEKLKAGQLSMVQRASGGPQRENHRAEMRNHPQSEEFKKAHEELQKIDKCQRARTPNDRHKIRQEALYVDPNDTGQGWNRPCDIILPSYAKEFITDAVNDYSLEYDRFQRGNVSDANLEFFNALQEWSGRPVLPPPKWP